MYQSGAGRGVKVGRKPAVVLKFRYVNHIRESVAVSRTFVQ
jgi:hypothetical protein